MGYKQSPFPMVSGSSKHASALKDKGDEEHQNVHGKKHTHPPGKPFTETSLSDEEKKALTEKGAEVTYPPGPNDPHNIAAEKDNPISK